MQVLIESREPAAAPLRDLAERRLRFVMRRLSALVQRARLRLSDVNGPRGGLDKRCQLELATDGSGTVVVSAVARDWRSALDAVLARASRTLARRERRGRQRRTPLRPGAADIADAPAH